MKRIHTAAVLLHAVTSWLVLAGPSLALAAAVPEFKKVENAKEIPGLIEKVKGSIGHHFMLDNLPATTKTLEEGFKYLVTESQVDLVRDPLMRSKTVYGTEFTIERNGETLRVFVYCGKADFTGEFVYTLSRMGWTWPVYLYLGK